MEEEHDLEILNHGELSEKRMGILHKDGCCGGRA